MRALCTSHLKLRDSILELPREVGDRFFGVFFSGACILLVRNTLAEFCRGKLHDQIAWEVS